MKKYFKVEGDNKKGRWSDGFSNKKFGKPDKKNKPKVNDDVKFEDGTVLLLDETATCRSLTGKVNLFAIKGGSLVVNGKKLA